MSLDSYTLWSSAELDMDPEYGDLRLLSFVVHGPCVLVQSGNTKKKTTIFTLNKETLDGLLGALNNLQSLAEYRRDFDENREAEQSTEKAPK